MKHDVNGMDCSTICHSHNRTIHQIVQSPSDKEVERENGGYDGNGDGDGDDNGTGYQLIFVLGGDL